MFGCGDKTYQKMAMLEPESFLLLEDSLRENGLSRSMTKLLIDTHVELGMKDFESKKYLEARQHYSKAMEYSKGDTLLMYYHLLSDGNILYQTGNKDKLWDAIKVFYKAARLKPRLGTPYYYIGLSYHRIGDKDFDLIIESFDNALDRELSNELRIKVEKSRGLAIERERRLKEFWK